MGIKKPYKRTVRIFTDNSYAKEGKSQYILYEKYAESPDNFVRAFSLIQQDLIRLFNYIEPADINAKTYFHRIHELLLRTCVEIEANWKAIFKENGYLKDEEKLTIQDYWKIEQSHYLSMFEVCIPYWKGQNEIRKPFKNWQDHHTLTWYQAYNQSKHNRHKNFEKANFENLIDAVAGLAVLMAAQFYTYSFSPSATVLALEDTRDGFESSIGGLFRIKYPTGIPNDEKYDFSY